MGIFKMKNWLVIAFLALMATTYFIFGLNPESNTEPLSEPLVQQTGALEAPEQTEQTDVSENSTTQKLLVQPSENEAIAQVADNVDGSHIENPESVLQSSPLSDGESAVDFAMMNPGLMDAAAMDDAEEIIVTTNPVNWSEAREHAQLPGSLLSDEQNSVIAQSNIPVFLPPDESLLSSANVNVGDSWFAASMNLPEVNVVVEGSNATMQGASENIGENVGTLGSYTIGRSLGMAEVVIHEFGVFYTVTVECSDLNDQHCSEDEFIAKIVDNLLLANSEGGEDGA